MTIVENETKPSAAKLSVLLADDHVRVLASAKELLSTHYRIVATATDGRSAVELANELHPDLIVLDIAMPEMDGFRAAQEIGRSGSKAKIVFLTVLEDEAFITAARSCGNGYVLKSRMHSDLRHAIEEALAGRFFVSPQLSESKK